MPVLEYAGLKINVDDEGYLENADDWNEKAARALAEKEGVGELTEDRMEIIRFLREHYKKYNFFPILSSICKNCPPVQGMRKRRVHVTAYSLEGGRPSETEQAGSRVSQRRRRCCIKIAAYQCSGE